MEESNLTINLEIDGCALHSNKELLGSSRVIYASNLSKVLLHLPFISNYLFLNKNRRNKGIYFRKVLKGVKGK